MNKLSRIFFSFALLYGLAGIGLGLMMASHHEYTQTPTHAHTQLLGWVSFALFGLFYNSFPAAASGIMAKIHVVLAVLSSIVMLISLYIYIGGNASAEPVLAIASMVYGVSYLAFIAAMAPVIARG